MLDPTKATRTTRVRWVQSRVNEEGFRPERRILKEYRNGNPLSMYSDDQGLKKRGFAASMGPIAPILAKDWAPNRKSKIQNREFPRGPIENRNPLRRQNS